MDATEDSTVPPIVGTTADTTADTTVDITVTQWTPAVDTHNVLHSGHHSDDLHGRPVRRHLLGGVLMEELQWLWCKSVVVLFFLVKPTSS